MKSKLTHYEQQLLHLHNIHQILQRSRSLNLPLSGQSTAIAFYKKLISTTNTINHNQIFLIHAIIILACKAESIHPRFIVNQFSQEDRNIIFEYEREVALHLCFDFHIPSPYLRILGQIILLQEKGKLVITGDSNIDINETKVLNENSYYEMEIENNYIPYVVSDVNALWRTSVKNMDRMLIIQDEKFDVNYVAMAALEVPVFIFEEEKRNEIIEIRKKIKNINFPDETEIKKILKKLEEH
ncbi:hypothetical protein COBT_002438 [Conglomerata obtusa]